MNADTVCIYSGGMDSFTLVTEIHAAGRLHSCVSFNYGQRHAKELEYAAAYCHELGVPHTIIDLADIARSCLRGSALTVVGAPMPEGHSEEESMKATVVPSRNLIMLSIASAYAVSHGLRYVAIGVHAGDHVIYPDCRPDFIASADRTLFLANWDPVSVYAPYIAGDKRTILRRGFETNPALDYSKAWTCYKGEQIACGVCGSCQERLQAFAALGIEDPMEYESRVLLPKSGAK